MVCIEVDIVTGKSFISKLKSKHKGNAELFPYDEAKHEAVIRCSICTGEQIMRLKP